MINGLLTRFWSQSDIGCIVNRSIESDFDILNECIYGTIVDDHNRSSVNRLASVGLVRLGTRVIMNDQDETIKLQQTVKATELGRRVAKAR